MTSRAITAFFLSLEKNNLKFLSTLHVNFRRGKYFNQHVMYRGQYLLRIDR